MRNGNLFGILIMLAGCILLSASPTLALYALRLQEVGQTSFSIAIAHGVKECYVGDSFIVYGKLSHSGGYVWGGSGEIYVDGKCYGGLLITSGGYVSESISIDKPGTHSIYFVATEYGVTPSWSGADVKYYTDPIRSNAVTITVKERPSEPDVLLVSLVYDGVSKSGQYSWLCFIAGANRQSTKYGTQAYYVSFRITLQRQSGNSWVDVDEGEAGPNTWSVRFAYRVTPDMVGKTLRFRAVAEGYGAYGVSDIVTVTITSDMFASKQSEITPVKVETPIPVRVSDGETSTMAKDGETVYVKSNSQVTVESSHPDVEAEPKSTLITQETTSLTVTTKPLSLSRSEMAIRAIGIILLIAGMVTFIRASRK